MTGLFRPSQLANSLSWIRLTSIISVFCLAAATTTLWLQSHRRIGSNEAQLALHPAVRAHIDRLHGMAEGLQVNLTRMFGQYDPDCKPMPVIRREARRNDQLPAFSSPVSLPDVAAGVSAAEQHLPPANWSAELPDGFDWRAYVQYHPEWGSELDCEWKAAEHYKRHGAPSGKWYSRLRVILRYTVLGGLINQQLGHISVFMLAAATGAELIVPPAFTRGSFAVDEHATPWTPLPVDELLDMPAVTKYWQRRGIIVHPSPEMLPEPSRGAPDQVYTGSDLRPELKTWLPVGGYDARDLDDVAEALRIAAVGHAEVKRRENSSIDIPYVVVDIPGWVFAINYTSSPQLAWETTGSLQFAPTLVAQADSMVEQIKNRSSEFNAVHLRIEADMAAAPWLFDEPLGDPENILSIYLNTMRQLNFSDTVAVYAASGLFAYDQSSVAHISGKMTEAGLCKAMLHREALLPASVEAGLTPIQRSAIDFLVMTHSQRFVGLSASSLSSFVMYYRMQNGFAPTTNMFVGRSWIVRMCALI